MRRRRRLNEIDTQISDVRSQLTETNKSVNALRKEISQLDALVRQLHADAWNVSGVRAEALQGVIQVEAHRIQELVRQLALDEELTSKERHAHLSALATQNHADMWDANERRALSLADVVLLSMSPKIEEMKQDLIALIGEKAVEVFRERSSDG